MPVSPDRESAEELRWRRLATVGAGVLLGIALAVTVAPMFENLRTYGFHDWDSQLAYRYVTVLNLERYGEGPWWDPWLCGGVPGWAFPEGAPNLVSPYLPVYLLADLRVAMRLEIVGQALLGIVGAYLFAGRFTEAPALRALVAVLFALNGRWAMQAAVGHSWHLQYALTPWVFAFFDRALSSRALRPAVYAAIALALMIYWDGVYPITQTALLIYCYTLVVALERRTAWPLAVFATTAAVSLGLAAPKLAAVLDFLSRFPRRLGSPEAIGLHQLLIMLTDRAQRLGAHPVAVPAYAWHEWGIYVGWAGVACFVLGLGFGLGLGDRRARAVALTGLLALLLGLGAFHPLAPWSLLHAQPVFSSQHVPSRFLHPMTLLLAAAFVATVGPPTLGWTRRRPWLHVALLVPVACVAADLAHVARVPFSQAFWLEAPDRIDRRPVFEQRTHAPVAYQHPDWPTPELLAMMANVGVVDSYGFDPFFKSRVVGADDPRYRGLAFVEGGGGRADIQRWTPNTATVQVHAATPGAWLLYDMNFDPSWRANGASATERDGLVAAALAAGDQTITFRYFPRTLRWTPFLLAATLAVLIVLGVRGRRRAHPAAEELPP